MSSKLSAEFKNVIKTLEENIKDTEILELVKVQMFNLYNSFFEEISKLEDLANSRMAEISQMQANMEEKLKGIEKEVKNISVDIYGEEEGEYDFTVTCPYCNNEFTVEVDELGNEITCPECNNVIELDWGHECDDDNCDSCNHHCHYDEDDEM